MAKRIDMVLGMAIGLLIFLIFAFLLGVVLAFVSPQALDWIDTYGNEPYAPLIDYGLGILVYAGLFPLVEGFCIGLFGTTPAKALMGIRLRRADGRKPGLGQSIARSYGAIVWGLSLGLPLLNFVAMILSYNRLQEQGTTRWDDKTGIVYDSQPVHPLRWVFGIMLAICAIAIDAAASFAF